jgi:hypothetical protein
MRDLEKRVEPWNENNVLPENQPPPVPTEAEARLQQMILDLGTKYDMLSMTMDQKQSGKESLVNNLFRNTESMFTNKVAIFNLPKKFKVSNIPIFTSCEDPIEHLDNFRSHTSLLKTPDAVACRAFPLTLSGKAHDWLKSLLPKSIDSFDTLGKKFLAQFMSRKVRRKPQGYLLFVRQGLNESLKDYL